MYLRCASCPATPWVQPAWVAHNSQVACSCCGKVYPLGDTSDLGTSARQHRERTRSFADNHDLDMAGSYSVLLGILSLEQAIEARAKELLHERAGDLAARHALSEEVALQVVGRRKRLHVALRERNAGPRGLRLASTSDLQRLALSVAGIIGLLACLGLVRQHWNAEVARSARVAVDSDVALARTPVRVEPEAATPASRPAPADVTFDDAGRIVRIDARDPAGVLFAFCESNELRNRARPLELASPAGLNRPVWFGLFSNLEDLSGAQAIQIRRDRKTRRWVAGDGKSPLRVLAAAETRLGERRFPLAGKWAQRTSGGT